jgi:hypothetical protein
MTMTPPGPSQRTPVRYSCSHLYVCDLGDQIHHPHENDNNRKISPTHRTTCPPLPPKDVRFWPHALHLPLSTRLGEISLRPAAHIGDRGRFWPIWPSWYPQRPSAAQPPRPKFLKGAPGAGHGWRPPQAGRPPLSRRQPLGRPSRETSASREAISTCAPPRSL